MLSIAGDTLTQPLTRYGAYADNEPWPDLSAHYDLERLVDARLGMMSWFQNWDREWLKAQAAAAARRGYELQICWEPMKNGYPVRFSDILAGYHDDYLRRYFVAAASYPRPVIIRPMHEMNGNWYPWALANKRPDCVTSAQEWIDAWRHIVTLQRRVSGGRVRWAWCPNNVDVGGIAAETYYPGSEYVDVLSLDGYNGSGSWATPYQVINPMYRRLSELDATAPVIVGEIGCREPTAEEAPVRSKAAWLKQLFTETRWSRLTHVNFFHASKTYDWRLDSSPAALATARRYLTAR